MLVVDDHVVRLDVAVHDAVGVAEVQGYADLVDVVADVKVRERGVQHLEVAVVHILEDEAGRLGQRVPHNVQQADDVGPTAQVLQDLDLTLDLLLLQGPAARRGARSKEQGIKGQAIDDKRRIGGQGNQRTTISDQLQRQKGSADTDVVAIPHLNRLQDLDAAAGVVDDIHAVKDLAVLAAADLADDFVVLLVAPIDGEGLVIPVLARASHVDVSVDASARHLVRPHVVVRGLRWVVGARSRCRRSAWGSCR